jgi:hypothetical protein
MKNEFVLKLLADIEDTNDGILKLSTYRIAPSNEGLGFINNHACDIAHFLKMIKEHLTTE